MAAAGAGTCTTTGAAVVGAVGFFLPDILLYNSGIKRQARILTGLPDALDMLTVCVEAGLGFDAALAQVARAIPGLDQLLVQRIVQRARQHLFFFTGHGFPSRGPGLEHILHVIDTSKPVEFARGRLVSGTRSA